MEVDEPNNAEDDEISFSESSDSSDLPSDSDMELDHPGGGPVTATPVVKDQKMESDNIKEGEETSPYDPELSLSNTASTTALKERDANDSEDGDAGQGKIIPTSTAQSTTAKFNPVGATKPTNSNEASSMVRISVDDHGELDFDESEDEGDFPKRDWKNEPEDDSERNKHTKDQEDGQLNSTNEGEEEVKDNVIPKKKTKAPEGKPQEGDDCEDGEIRSDDEDTSSPDEEALDEIEHPHTPHNHPPPQALYTNHHNQNHNQNMNMVYDFDDRILCRFFSRGNCHFGVHCRFLHPGVNDMPPPPGPHGPPGPPGPPMSMRLGPPPPQWGPDPHMPMREPSPESASPPPARVPSPKAESAWERGLRHAKRVREAAKKRKEKETDFEDKRMNLSVQVVDDEKLVMERKKGMDSVVEVVKDKENKENENYPPHPPPSHHYERGPMKPDPYYEDPNMPHRDPYYDQGYDDYYGHPPGPPQGPPHGPPHGPPGEWGHGPPPPGPPPPHHYEQPPYQAHWAREPEYPPPQQHYKKDYPPPKSRPPAEYHEPPPNYRKPPPSGPPPDYSPEKEREYWNKRREDEYRKLSKHKALKDNVSREEEPINRVRGEQWSDPWARTREPPRRKKSKSSSRSRSRRKGSLSGSSSYSSSSRSRSRSSSYSSSYSSRSSYSRSSSLSSRSRSPKKNRPTNTLGAAVKKNAAKTLDGGPRSTITKVDERRRPGGPPPSGPPSKGGPPPKLPPPGARGPPPQKPGSTRSGPPPSKGGPPPGRSGGPPSKAPPQQSPQAAAKVPQSPPITSPAASKGGPPVIKGGPPPARKPGIPAAFAKDLPAKENKMLDKEPLPKKVESVKAPAPTPSLPESPEKGRKDRKELPGRMIRKRPPAYSSSSSSGSRSRSRSSSGSRSRSGSRSSRSSSSSSSGSSSSSEYQARNRKQYGMVNRRPAVEPDKQRDDRRKPLSPSARRPTRPSDGPPDRHRGGPDKRPIQSDSRQDRSGMRRDLDRKVDQRGGRPGDRHDRPPERSDRPREDRPRERMDRGPERMGDRMDKRDRPDERRGVGDRPDRQKRHSDISVPDSNKAKDSQKSNVKMTIKSDKLVQRPKRTVSNGSTEEPEHKKGKPDDTHNDKTSKKAKDSSASKSGSKSQKKSTSSRREELLKQLKAVESAIYKKRSKLS